ncbi:TIGR02466 family protein [Sphingomonas sp.]|uniref:TIGR02466 family protein n=1 Tax=Sphingomonas sp. TaxID=28214 RepID=UPI002DE61768|nr:TIGR02466 family protein [Sphingomonas sp.]
MIVRSLFTTPLYQAELGEPALLDELADAVRMLAAEDRAGRAWSKEKGYRGYTSYASLNDLPRRDPRFSDLARLLDKHVVAFAKACAFDLAGRKLKLDSIWVNVLKPGGAHSGHIHPHSVVSGTVYVETPLGGGAIRFEDPRLPLLMAAPPRAEDAPDPLRSFVTVEPRPGTILLWESWLRHEVLPSTAKAERISISFNYRW